MALRNVDEVPVHHLVVDTCAIFKRAQIQDLGAVIYTTSGVIEELKCSKSRHLLESIPYEVVIREPTKESLTFMKVISKKTGDYRSLSATDLKVLALLFDLHLTESESKSCTNVFHPQTSIDEDVWMDDALTDSATCSVLSANDVMVGHNSMVIDKVEVDHKSNSDESESGSEEEWIDESNAEKHLLNFGVVEAKGIKVACITTDFAMQNVILRLGLNLVSCEGAIIKRLKSYVLRCRACFATTTEMERKFCHRCGHDLLHLVAVSVDEDGLRVLHINWERLNSKRGLKFSLPLPKGGKHSNDPVLFEDQRIAHNRLAKCKVDETDSSPFKLNDVHSRSSMLGVKTVQRNLYRNPNMSYRGRKRGNKKR